jgi:RNA polymerase sigma-70 factor, ECF subfamily
MTTDQSLQTHPFLAKPSTASAAHVEEWFLACEVELGRYLVQFVRDRSLAEDLLQETFHDAYRARPAVADVRNPRAWLFGIARNRALASLRRQRRFHHAFARLRASAHTGATPADTDVGPLFDLLERQLSPEDRAFVLLRYLYGFEAPDLAEMTGLSAAAVRQRLSRARVKLIDAESSEPTLNERT